MKIAITSGEKLIVQLKRSLCILGFFPIWGTRRNRWIHLFSYSILLTKLKNCD